MNKIKYKTLKFFNLKILNKIDSKYIIYNI